MSAQHRSVHAELLASRLCVRACGWEDYGEKGGPGYLGCYDLGSHVVRV